MAKNDYIRAWRDSNREHYRQYYRDYRKKRKAQGIGPTQEEKERQLASNRKRKFGEGAHEYLLVQVEDQNNQCAICKEEFVKTPHLDHNHVTGQWRSALCASCNHRVGVLEKSPDLVKASLQYISEWNAKENKNG